MSEHKLKRAQAKILLSTIVMGSLIPMAHSEKFDELKTATKEATSELIDLIIDSAVEEVMTRLENTYELRRLY